MRLIATYSGLLKQPDKQELSNSLELIAASHAGSGPPTVVFGGIGGAYGADGTFGAITGWRRR